MFLERVAIENNIQYIEYETLITGLSYISVDCRYF